MITDIPSTPESKATVIARCIIDSLKAEMTHRASIHQNLFRTVWQNPDATPEQIFEALGSRGKSVLDVAGMNVQSLAALAPHFDGKTLADYPTTEDYTRPREYTESGGVITLTAE